MQSRFMNLRCSQSKTNFIVDSYCHFISYHPITVYPIISHTTIITFWQLAVSGIQFLLTLGFDQHIALKRNVGRDMSIACVRPSPKDSSDWVFGCSTFQTHTSPLREKMQLQWTKKSNPSVLPTTI